YVSFMALSGPCCPRLSGGVIGVGRWGHEWDAGDAVYFGDGDAPAAADGDGGEFAAFHQQVEELAGYAQHVGGFIGGDGETGGGGGGAARGPVGDRGVAFRVSLRRDPSRLP